MEWLNGKFPLSIETIKEMVADRYDLPDGFHVNDYELFQGMPTKVLADHDIIDIGGRKLVYKDILFAYFNSYAGSI